MFPHRYRNLGLGHPAFAQQHHLDALAHGRMSSTPQRSFQPPQLAFVAFDHLFTPNQTVSANHIPRPMKIRLQASARPPYTPSIHAAMEVV
jgi:hypothetical protein